MNLQKTQAGSAITIVIIVIILIVISFFVLNSYIYNEKQGEPTTNQPGTTTPTVEPAAKITYINATANNIVPELPFPGAVVGKEFTVIGKARGTWFFEASFPIDVLDKDGKKIAGGYAQAEGEWMTENFVPFKSIVIKIPQTYIGSATLVLHKDNPSGESRFDASISFPITIEY